MTRIVDGLCREGLAERARHPSNGRAVLISATSAGLDLMRKAADRRVEALVAALSRLDATAQANVRAAAPAIVELGELLRRPPRGTPVADQ
jgi:DNA-binding MarR family transcriptional regulator